MHDHAMMLLLVDTAVQTTRSRLVGYEPPDPQDPQSRPTRESASSELFARFPSHLLFLSFPLQLFLDPVLFPGQPSRPSFFLSDRRRVSLHVRVLVRVRRITHVPASSECNSSTSCPSAEAA